MRLILMAIIILTMASAMVNAQVKAVDKPDGALSVVSKGEWTIDKCDSIECDKYEVEFTDKYSKDADVCFNYVDDLVLAPSSIYIYKDSKTTVPVTKDIVDDKYCVKCSDGYCKLGTESIVTIYQEQEIVGYQVDDVEFNATLTCDDDNNQSIYVYNSPNMKFGANVSSARDTIECSYNLVSNSDIYWRNENVSYIKTKVTQLSYEEHIIDWDVCYYTGCNGTASYKVFQVPCVNGVCEVDPSVTNFTETDWVLNQTNFFANNQTIAVSDGNTSGWGQSPVMRLNVSIGDDANFTVYNISTIKWTDGITEDSASLTTLGVQATHAKTRFNLFKTNSNTQIATTLMNITSPENILHWFTLDECDGTTSKDYGYWGTDLTSVDNWGRDDLNDYFGTCYIAGGGISNTAGSSINHRFDESGFSVWVWFASYSAGVPSQFPGGAGFFRDGNTNWLNVQVANGLDYTITLQDAVADFVITDTTSNFAADWQLLHVYVTVDGANKTMYFYRNNVYVDSIDVSSWDQAGSPGNLVYPSDTRANYRLGDLIIVNGTISETDRDSFWEHYNWTYGFTEPIAGSQSLEFLQNFSIDFIDPQESGADVTGPTVTLNSPAAGSGTNFTNVSITYTPSDVTDVAFCILHANFTGTPENYTNHTSPINNDLNLWNVTLNNGTFAWNVTCEDSAGNFGESVEQTFTFDDTSPTNIFFNVNTSTPESGQGVNVTSVGTDNLQLENATIYNNHTDATTIIEFLNGNISISQEFTVSGGAVGDVILIQVNYTDSANNMISNSTEIVISDNTAPTINQVAFINTGGPVWNCTQYGGIHDQWCGATFELVPNFTFWTSETSVCNIDSVNVGFYAARYDCHTTDNISFGCNVTLEAGANRTAWINCIDTSANEVINKTTIYIIDPVGGAGGAAATQNVTSCLTPTNSTATLWDWNWTQCAYNWHASSKDFVFTTPTGWALVDGAATLSVSGQSSECNVYQRQETRGADDNKSYFVPGFTTGTTVATAPSFITILPADPPLKKCHFTESRQLINGYRSCDVATVTNEAIVDLINYVMDVNTTRENTTAHFTLDNSQINYY